MFLSATFLPTFTWSICINACYVGGIYYYSANISTCLTHCIWIILILEKYFYFCVSILVAPPSSRPISFGDSLPSQTSHKNGNDTWGESGFATFNFSQSSFSNGGADSNSNKSSSSIFEDSKRQDAIQELISTEETYMADMKIVKNVKIFLVLNFYYF